MFGIAMIVLPQYFQQKEEKRKNESLKSRDKEIFVTRVIGVLFIIFGILQMFLSER